MHKSAVAQEKAEKAMLLTGDSFPSKVKLIYMGRSRPVGPERQKLLAGWSKALKDSLPPNVVELFKSEMLFKENGTEHWIAVQKPLLEFLPKEVKANQQITGFIIWIGAIKVQGQWDWLFAMNEFDGP